MASNVTSASTPDSANWPPVHQFSQAAKFAYLIGRNSTYINLDDLPLGATLRGGVGGFECGKQPQPCIYTAAEQRSIFTLYAMCRSPIMFSGALPADAATLALVTNARVLAIQQSSRNNRQVSNTRSARVGFGGMRTRPVTGACAQPLDSYQCSEVVWVADGDSPATKYVAVFWTGPGSHTATVDLEAAGVRHVANGTNLWTGAAVPVASGATSVTLTLGEHDVALLQFAVAL